MGKRTKRRIRAAAPTSPDFEHAEAMAGEGNARIVVMRRVRVIDRLLKAGKITKMQMAALETYHAAFLNARLDGGRSCLAVGFGGNPEPRAERIMRGRQYEGRLRAAIPVGCVATVDAVVIAGLSIELVASVRVPPAVAHSGLYAGGRRRIRADHASAVLAELRCAADALAIVGRVAA